MHFFLNNETLVEEVLKLYPAGDFDDSDDERAAMVLRDCFFACPMRRAARAIDANGESAFLYHFTYPIHWVEGGLLGDYHASELAFVWGNPWPAIVHAFNSKDRTMSDSFQRFWGNMAHHGTPNGNLSDATAAAAAGRVWWPRHNSSDDMSIVMDVPVSQQQHLLEDKCAFWDANMQN